MVLLKELLFFSILEANSLCSLLKSGTSFLAGGLKAGPAEFARLASVSFSFFYFSYASILGGSLESDRLTSAFFFTLLSLSSS